MKLKVIGILGVSALLSACAHHPAPPPPPANCSDYVRPGDVPPPPPGHHWGKDTPPPPRPCHPPRADHKPNSNVRSYGIFGTEPYRTNRDAPWAARRESTPDTGVNDNYPFWR